VQINSHNSVQNKAIETINTPIQIHYIRPKSLDVLPFRETSVSKYPQKITFNNIQINNINQKNIQP
jgi:hypothetical protein